MAKLYKIITKDEDFKDSRWEGVRTILKTDEGLCIPEAEGNRHYQEYLTWVAEGNTAEPADE